MKNNFIYFFMFLFLISGCSHQKYLGEEYLGKKYVLNPLGEEKSPDTDPLIRYDAFDCTTFVETSLANGDVNKLNQIRYKNGKVDFINRNHFTELDWINNNKSLVDNVSSKYGQTAVRHVIINKKNWFKKMHNTETNFVPTTVDIEYIPYSLINKIENKETLIVLFISGNSKKYDKIETDLAVTHMGFLLPNGKLRHASRAKGCVTDMDFYEYINDKKQDKNNLGIALLEIK